MLLSTGKDGKAFLWDMSSGLALGNATMAESWANAVAWAPTLPGVFAVSSVGQEGTAGKVRPQLHLNAGLGGRQSILP